MKRHPELAALVERHQQLETTLETRRSRFISDWNCDNPLIEPLLGAELLNLASNRQSTDSYIYFDEEPAVLDGITRFHLTREGIELSRTNVLAGPGSSSFLAAFSIWLRRSGYTEIYYQPPLYHNFHYLLESLDINVSPLTNKHIFEPGYTMKLPARRTVLLMCDPVWYAGKRVPKEQIAAIAEWQQATRSLVFIDGSFQYMQWDGIKDEKTAMLDPELTFRLICPAKTLAVPFFRFAYLLHPGETHQELMFLYESIVGGASASDLVFAQRALQVLNNDSLNRMLTDFYVKIYHALIGRDLIRTDIAPECGYFVFAVPTNRPANMVTMDGSYFELKGHTGYCRINLMAARRIYGLEDVS
ncbi:MAG TPA: aminotransferase class I/II-fold pyridoxal phosphate-dependent enzyme [Candidatus Dormibacteraeota bacterium]|jgi:aspartate/methionine/tyrosine aminotransferase|nr:aminotransferase class I/II-fold pyridoxal phosphate-dependent enzyme [Candidatus Dormibacteraeota bacterium]